MSSPRRTSPARTQAALPRIGKGSLTEQTTEVLLEAVLDRRFPSDHLPAEPELAAQMGVSRTTVRAALQALDRLGVVSRAPGRGTQLRPHVGRESMLLHRLFGFRGILEGRFEEITIDQVFTISESASPAARSALGLAVDTPVLVNAKTYLADGQPAVHLHQEVPVAYLPAGLAEKLVGGDVSAPSTITEFSRSWKKEIDHSVIELVPRVAPRNSNSFPIPMKPGTPYLELCETHYAEDNEPIAYACETVDDKFVRLKLVRTR